MPSFAPKRVTVSAWGHPIRRYSDLCRRLCEMSVARLATFDEPPPLQADDARRARTLFELLGSLPGFEGAYYLREEASGRLISLTIWESEQALEAAERAVAERPAEDQRGINPSRVERWVVDASF
jgi:heme-degrading monooxygenase HmoA